MPRRTLTAAMVLLVALVFAVNIVAASPAGAERSAYQAIESPDEDGSLFSLSLKRPLSDREQVILTLLAGVMVLAMTSFLLAGRASLRFHICMALLIVIIAAFGLLILLGTSGALKGALGALVFFALIFVLRSMSQFEAPRKGR